MIHLSDSYMKSGMKKLIAALPCLQKLYIDAMQCTWNIYCLSEIMQWISVAKELQFLSFKMRSDQGEYGFEQVISYLRHSNFYQLTQKGLRHKMARGKIRDVLIKSCS